MFIIAFIYVYYLIIFLSIYYYIIFLFIIYYKWTYFFIYYSTYSCLLLLHMVIFNLFIQNYAVIRKNHFLSVFIIAFVLGRTFDVYYKESMTEFENSFTGSERIFYFILGIYSILFFIPWKNYLFRSNCRIPEAA